MNRKALKKWAVVLIVIVILAAVFLVFRKRDTKETATQQIHTEAAEKRDLIKSVGSTGTVVSRKSKDISANLSGVEVRDVEVEVGDTVKKGDLLLSFDVDNIKKDLADAEKSLSDTESRSGLTQKDADRTVKDAKETSDYQIDMAKDTMKSAKKEYQTLKKEYHQAKQELVSLKAQEKKVEAAYRQSQNQAEKTAYDEAVAKTAAQEETVKSLKKQRDTAKSTYTTAKKNYEYTKKVQKSSVDTSKSNAASVQYSTDTSAQESQIRQYAEQAASEKLYAPFDGIVTAVNYDKGDIYTGGSLLTVQDCSEYEIEVNIGEYDISDIEVGQKVFIKTDATGEDEISGKVKKISPVAGSAGSSDGSGTEAASSVMGGMSAGVGTASSSGGSSDISYPVTIELDEQNERLKLDMSANVSIILEEHTDVLTVPYNAVQSGEDGSDFVTVVEESGQEKKVDVEVVMESNYYTEIRSDSVSEGTKVKVVDEEKNTTFLDAMQGGGF